MYNRKNLSQEQLLQNIDDLHALLGSGYEVGQDSSGWPDYDDLVFAGINAALTLLGPDFKYTEHRDSLSAETIPSASKEELSTWFTLMTRGEYFSTGYVAGAIATGDLQAITQRLVTLLAR